jgi:serine protease Do
VIVSIDGKELRNSAELTEYVGRQKPGDKILLGIVRQGDPLNVDVELLNIKGNTDVVKSSEGEAVASLGVQLEELSSQELQKYGLKGGLKITRIDDGKIRQFTDIRPGFIITSIDNQVVTSAEHLEKILRNKSGGVMMEGIYPGRPGLYYYAFGM